MSDQLELSALVGRMGSQRWGRRSCSWRPGEEVFDPALYGVEVIEGDAEARAFVVEHHYSGSYPAARCRVGLYRSRGPWSAPQLVGVAVFSVPMNQRVIPARCGVPADQGVELGRLVLLDEVPAPGETWFLARAFRLLRAALPDVRAVVSYSDPMPRRDMAGELVMPGHIGVIYQGHNGIYRGRATARTLWLDGRGRVASGRTLSKIRSGERGVDYACKSLEAMGAPPRARHEDGAAYVRRALESGAFRKLRHPGNHIYVWGLDRRTRKALGCGEEYPRREEVCGG